MRVVERDRASYWRGTPVTLTALYGTSESSVANVKRHFVTDMVLT